MTSAPIAVFGATGKQGGSVVDGLLRRGVSVRALVRDPSATAAKALAERGVDLAPIAVEDPDSLVSALTGVAGFYFMTALPVTEDPDEERVQGVRLADAAAAAAVPRVVFSSVGGAERSTGIPHFEAKRRIEEHLESLGIPTTVIRPVFFMESFSWMLPVIENDHAVLRLPLPDGIPLQMIAVQDIGEVVAAASVDATVPAGSALEIAGDALTGSQIADAFGRAWGVPARYEPLPIQVLDGQGDLQAMFAWFADTPAYQADLDAARRIAPNTSTLHTWVKRNAPRPVTDISDA